MKSQKQLESFTAYCKMYPDLRFWQALRNWSKFDFIFGRTIVSQVGTGEKTLFSEKDTYYLE